MGYDVKKILNSIRIELLFNYQLTKKGRKMADRKQFLNPRPADPELLRILEASKDHPVTEDDLREQRISFAFGNAPASNLITKETVRRASEKIKLR